MKMNEWMKVNEILWKLINQWHTERYLLYCHILPLGQTCSHGLQYYDSSSPTKNFLSPGWIMTIFPVILEDQTQNLSGVC